MIGRKIRQARIFAGLTQDQVVAELRASGMRLTKAALSKYELDKSMPKPSTVRALSQALNVKPSYLLRESPIEIDWIAFRKSPRLGAREQARIQAAALRTAESQVRLQELLHPQRAPEFPAKRTVSTFEDAEGAAEALRLHWRLGTAPLESVTQTFEDHGGIVLERPEEDGKFHGLAGWVNRRYPLAVVSGEASADRKRFNLAHEMGHLLMDASAGAEDEEKLAHRFAAAFIVPRETALKELGERRKTLPLEELEILKAKHGLSMQAWAYRAYDLGVVGKTVLERTFSEITKRGWRKVEPETFQGKEQPVRLRQMANRALAEGVITPEEAQRMRLDLDQQKPDGEERRPEGYLLASVVRALPAAERRRILEAASASSRSLYQAGGELAGFPAFEMKDAHDA